MGIQQQLLQKLGDSLVLKFQQSIEQTKATGETMNSIHAVSDAFSVTVYGAKHLGALEYGRKPSEQDQGGKLYPAILRWVQAKGITDSDGIKSSKYTQEERTAKRITYFIHKKGTALFYKTDYYGHVKPSQVISGVLEQLNLNSLLKDLTALQIADYSSEVIRELKQLQ